MRMARYELSEKEMLMVDIIANKVNDGRSFEDIVTDLIESKLAELTSKEFVAEVRHGDYSEWDYKEEYGESPTRY